MNAFDLTPVLTRTDPGFVTSDMERPIYVPSKPLTEEALCDWIASSVAGERIQYHQGLLLVDRSEASSTLPVKERKRVHALAKRAWIACELGLVHLVSRRIAPLVFAYIAVRSLMAPSAAQIRERLRSTTH